MMYQDKIVLDPYDHPVRDFLELPATISTDEPGCMIEFHLRKNRQISAYDLMGKQIACSLSLTLLKAYSSNEKIIRQLERSAAQ